MLQIRKIDGVDCTHDCVHLVLPTQHKHFEPVLFFEQLPNIFSVFLLLLPLYCTLQLVSQELFLQKRTLRLQLYRIVRSIDKYFFFGAEFRGNFAFAQTVEVALHHRRVL